MAYPTILTGAYDLDRKYWLTIGLAGWAAVAVIAAADIGLQKALSGEGFVGAPADILAIGLWVVPGAALSTLVIPAFRTARRASGSPGIPMYVGMGIGFWMGWAVLHALFLQSGLGPAHMAQPSLRAGVATALPGHLFTAVTLYAVIVVLYESSLDRTAARERELKTARLRSQVARAQAAALAARLDPHFLFNTLHVASGLLTVDAKAATRVLSDLRALLDSSVQYGEARLVRLEQEVALVERYLRIQRARFGSRLEAEIRVAPGLLPLRVPPLVIQPLVENAVQHGVGRHPTGGSLTVVAFLDDGDLAIEVFDSGSGITTATTVDEGVGLGGVRARLDLAFGPRGQLESGSAPAGGFRAVVRVPAGSSH